MNRYDENRLKENPEIEPYFNDISRETAERAYNGTSMSPDRAGSLVRSGYALSIIRDTQQVARAIDSAIKSNADTAIDKDVILRDWKNDHREGLKRVYLDYLASHGRVFSSFITGPANFPVRRMEKLNGYADAKLALISEFRKKSIKRVIKSIFPYGDGTAIKTDDPKATKKIDSRTAELELSRDNMKLGNKAYLMAVKMGIAGTPVEDIPADKIDKIQVKTGIKNRAFLISVITFVPPYSYISRPFTFEITNIGTNIRRLKERVIEVKRTQSTEINDTFPGGETVTISEDKKIVIEFGYKPSEEVRTVLKSKAFKWSRFRGAWVRKLTQNAVYAYFRTVKPMLTGDTP